MIEYSHYDSPMSPHSFLSIVHKRRMLILTLFVLVVGAATAAAFLLTPVYESSAKVMVNYPYDNEKAHLLGLNNSSSRPEYDRLASELVIFKMRSVLEPVVNKLALDQPVEGEPVTTPQEAARLHDETIARVAKKLNVEREKNTNILNISYLDPDPRLAANIVDKVVTEYIEQRPALDRDDRAYQFFDEQINEIKSRIDDMERKQMHYKRQEHVLLPDQQSQILFSSLSDFDSELTQVRSKRISKEAKLKIIREQIASGKDIAIPTTETSESTSRHEYLNELKKTLLKLELRKATLEKKYTAKHPDLVNVVSDIRETKQSLEKEVNEIIQAEEASIKALMAQEQALVGSMNQVVNSVKHLSQQEYELGKLSIGIDDMRMVYSMLLRQREEARISASKKEYLVQVRLLEPALVPYAPAKPNKPLFITLGFVLGIFVSFGFAFFLEYFDHSVNTVEDAHHCLGLPILAAIPDFRTTNGNGHQLESKHNGQYTIDEKVISKVKFEEE